MHTAHTYPRFAPIMDRALVRHGGERLLQAQLPDNASAAELIATPDDRYLAAVTQCVFKAGFVWRVIRNKWPDFEAAFDGFVPIYWQQVPPEVLEDLAKDPRVVRNAQKINTVPHNARMIVEASQRFNGFGQFLADWPSNDQAGLMKWFKQHGARLGGATPQYFLRTVGWDGFILSNDVVAGLRREKVLDASPFSQKGLKQAQGAFNHWHEETGLPFSHLSRIITCNLN